MSMSLRELSKYPHRIVIVTVIVTTRIGVPTYLHRTTTVRCDHVCVTLSHITAHHIMSPHAMMFIIRMTSPVSGSVMRHEVVTQQTEVIVPSHRAICYSAADATEEEQEPSRKWDDMNPCGGGEINK